MTAELQNKAWTYLPEEVRDRIKEQYRALEENRQKQDKYNTEYLFAQAQLITIFGKRNLISISGPEEQKPKTPKTWSEFVKTVKVAGLRAEINTIWGDVVYAGTCRDTLIEKSALALLKIHQIIENGYGGNVSNEEWKDTNKLKWYFLLNKGSFDLMCSLIYKDKRLIAFHTKEQAEEFLSYPENVQLLKDYFII